MQQSFPSTPRIAIVADDLTGALDASAPFVSRGMRAVVATAPAHLARALVSGADLIAVSTNSREIPQPQAVEVLQHIATALRDVPILFKKIDSRLKGNVAAETTTIAAARGIERVLLCPAIPEMGRLMQGGEITGFGVTTPIPVREVLRGTGLEVMTSDALTDADIDAALADLPEAVLLVGARGLSAGLARKFGAKAPAPLPPLTRPIAFAIGSRDAITLAQVAHLRTLAPDALYCPAPNGVWTGATATSELAILQILPGPSPEDPASVTAAFAAAFIRHLVPGRRSLLLTGGETARAVLSGMGIGVLDLLGEVQPGLPLARPLDLPADLLIVAKSGGFGGEDALSRLLHPQDPPSK